MSNSGRWNRRRVLVAAGGMSALAGCAAEEVDPADEADDATDDDDDGSENADEDQDAGDDAQADDEDNGEDDPDEDGESVGEGDGETDEGTGEEGEGDDDPDEADEADGDGGEADEPDVSPITIEVVGPAGEPIEGTDVTGEGEPHEADISLEFSGETDAGGEYTDGIYENEYTIAVEHPDYEAETVEHTHDGDSELRVELDAAVDTASITVTVVGPAGERVEGADVTGEGEPHEADIPLEFSGETDADGEYTDVIYENEYAIEANHSDYDAAIVSHTHDGESEAQVELGSEVETSRLTLTISDPDGDPIEGVTIAGEGKHSRGEGIPLEFSGETDADGEYTDVVYQNNYAVEIDHSEYLSRTVHFIHARGTDLSLTLDPQ